LHLLVELAVVYFKHLMILYTLVSLFAGTLTSWCVIQLLRLKYVGYGGSANIQHHHVHSEFVPRIGGIGLITGFLTIFTIGTIFLNENSGISPLHLGVLGGSVAAFTLGLVDDFRPLSARLKLPLQVVIALLAHEFGLNIQTIVIPFTQTTVELGFFSYFLTVVWFVGLMNIINLIDGLDGLAGGIGIMLMGLLTLTGFSNGLSLSLLIAVGMGGAIFGFLLHNFPPAKVYMGDSGAYLLGFLIASLSLINSEKGTIVAAMIAPILALALPIVDVVFALLRRSIAGLPLFRPDSRHIHHRILRAGASRRSALLLLYSVSMLALLAGVLVFVDRGRYLGLFMGFAFVVILIALRGKNITASSIQVLLSDSLQSRQNTRNALYLKDWFIAEVDRADSGNHLWSDFHFILMKMGFCRAHLELNESFRSFYIPATSHRLETTEHEFKHYFKNKTTGQLVLHAEKDLFSERQFHLICDIALEAWIKGAEKWILLHAVELDFDAVAKESESYKSHNSRRLYRPTY